jgi:hypothetical protein
MYPRRQVDTIEHPAHARTGHRRVDSVLGIAAVVISLVSIFVAYHTSHSMEKLVQANSWPFLQLGHGNAFGETLAIGESSSAQIYFTVMNAGTGPAVIHDFEFRLDGQLMAADGRAIEGFLKICCLDQMTDGVQTGPTASSPVSQSLLAPNADLTILRWPLTPQNRSLWLALDRVRQQGRIEMAACYCSVFDECWVANTTSFPPRSVASCKAAAAAQAP